MQALILAAGRGTRLGGMIPKPLLPVGGQPLIIRLLEQFERFDIRDITVVLGPQRDMIERSLADWPVHIRLNQQFETTDNLYSFWIGSIGLVDDLIVAHADLIFDDDLIRRLLSAGGDVVLPLDRSSMDEESMKIRLRGRLVTEISKALPLAEAHGESIPLLKFSRQALPALREAVQRMVATGRLASHLEDVLLELYSHRHLRMSALDVTGIRWAEIDTPEDLERARKLFETAPP
ncbi:MAG TPA: phosphocholine cytidylyltransferase family protein [bacterium]|jgi:choline kinase